MERLARQSLKKEALSTVKTTATTSPKKKRCLLKDSSSSSGEEPVAVVLEDSDNDMSCFDNERPNISAVDWPNEYVQVTKGNLILL